MDNERSDQQKLMDADAIRARRELEPNLDSWRARDVVDWWNRWYLRAGHKRLGRALVELAKNSAKKKEEHPE
jgi:hypothetical protein